MITKISRVGEGFIGADKLVSNKHADVLFIRRRVAC